MDAGKFGQWLAAQRWSYGYSSQRAMIEAVLQHPQLGASGLSEAFLARLESGVLAFPFRGRARAKVFALAQFLCGSPSELRLFLRHAELGELSAHEHAHVQRLYAYLSAPAVRPQVIAPARPAQLVGRTMEVAALLYEVRSMESGCCAITGMPGVGKTALAAEVLHRLTTDIYELTRLFPDGIVTLTGTGRHGLGGLIAVLEELSLFVSRPLAETDNVTHNRRKRHAPQRHDVERVALQDADLATAIDCARLLLADKSVLVLLDDLEADFPLRQLLDVIVTQIRPEAHVSPQPADATASPLLGRRVVLVTSQHVPEMALLAKQIALAPLEPDAAQQLFAALTSIQLAENEREDTERICASLGYLPSAIEIAAAAVMQEKMPLAIVVRQAQTAPLDLSHHGTRELRATLARALARIDCSAYERLAHIALQFANMISFNDVATLESEGKCEGVHEQVLVHPDAMRPMLYIPSAEHLARAAVDVGQLLRHSLLTLVPPHMLDKDGLYYAIHPVVKAYVRAAILPELAELPELPAEALCASARDASLHASQPSRRPGRSPEASSDRDC